MAPSVRFRQVALRLLMLVAAVFCLLGLGETRGMAHSPSMPAMAMPMAAGANPMSAMSSPSLMSEASRPGFVPAEDSGHGSGVMQSMKCMSPSTVVVLGGVAAPAVAGVVTSAPTVAGSLLRSAVVAVFYPRPPDSAALCVQRT